MADNKVFPKQQLQIVQVQDPKPYSGGQKFLLPVVAKNLSLPEGDPLREKSLKYTVFNHDLQDHIKGLKVGDRFLSDIEERERPDSEYGPDRNIVQIYVGGKPVSQKAGGGGYRGRSLEDDLILEGVKRRSIEGQTAIAQVGLVLACPTPIPGEALGIDQEGWFRILEKYWQAVEKSLDGFLAEPVQKPQGVNLPAAKTEKVGKDSKPPSDPIKHVGELFGRAQKLDPPVTRDDLINAMSVNNVSEIKDLEAAWKTAQEISTKRSGEQATAEKEAEQLFK